MLNKGDRFCRSFVLSDKVYAGFIDLFQDRNPLHSDVSFAQKKGFSSVVMHGNILCGFLSFFVGECLPMKNVIIHSQEIQYIKPVYLNDTLSLDAEIADIFDSVSAILIKYIFKNQNEIKIAKGKIQIGII